MAKKLFLLVLVIVPFVLAACGDGSGDTSATTPEAQAAPDLVDAGMAINGEINSDEEHDPGLVRCLEAKNCTLSGMQCDVTLFKLCKQFGRVDEDTEILPEYLGD